MTLANVPAGVGVGIPRDDDECTNTSFLQLELERKARRLQLGSPPEIQEFSLS